MFSCVRCFVSLPVSNHLDWEEGADYFYFFSFLYPVNAVWLFVMVPVVCMQLVTVIFPGQTHYFS